MKISPNPKPFRFSLGERGEVFAAAYLQRAGFKILQKNYKCAIGEIDLIAEKAGRIHFVEIKTRAGQGFGRPEEAVDKRKKAKLLKLAAWYLKDKNLPDQKVSMDVMAVTWEKNAEPAARFFENAFEEGADQC